MPFNKISDTDRILIALTSLALNAPSSYTIAWSKEQHREELPILYAGIATSATTVAGALFNDKLMWVGLLATMGLFGYVAFVYHPKQIEQPPQPIIIGDNRPSSPVEILIV